MQSARGADDVQPRPEIEMIGVPQDDLGAHLIQFARVQRFHAGLCAHRHEYRRIHHTVRGGQLPQARFRGRIGL